MATIFALFFMAGWLAHPIHIFHGARMIRYLLEGLVMAALFVALLFSLDGLLIILGQRAEFFKTFLFVLIAFKVLPAHLAPGLKAQTADLAGLHYVLLIAFLLFLALFTLLLYHKRRKNIERHAQSQFITYIRGDLRLAGRIVKIIDGVEDKSQYETENQYEFQKSGWKKIAASKSIIADEHIQKRYANEEEFRRNEPVEKNPTALIQDVYVEVFIKDALDITYLLNEPLLKYIDSDSLFVGRTEIPVVKKGEKINLRIDLYNAHTRTQKSIPILVEWPIPAIPAEAVQDAIALRGAAWERGVSVHHETELQFWEAKQEEYRELNKANVSVSVKDEDGVIIYMIPTLQDSAELRVMISPQAVSRMLRQK